MLSLHSVVGVESVCELCVCVSAGDSGGGRLRRGARPRHSTVDRHRGCRRRLPAARTRHHPALEGTHSSSDTSVASFYTCVRQMSLLV